MSNNYSIKEWSNLIKNNNLIENNLVNDTQVIIRPETIINKDTVITQETVITPDIKDYPETNETIDLQRRNSFINNIYNKLPNIHLLFTMLSYHLKYIRI